MHLFLCPSNLALSAPQTYVHLGQLLNVLESEDQTAREVSAKKKKNIIQIQKTPIGSYQLDQLP